MRITDIEVAESADGARLAGTLAWDAPRIADDRLEYVYRGLPADAILTTGDALVAAALVPAMAVGEDIVVEAPVSRTLLRGLDRITEIYGSWRTDWHRPAVEAPPADRADLRPQLVASLFSGGVDSFFTALRPRDEAITVFISMNGFTVYTELLPKLDAVMAELSRAAHALGRRQIVVESNALRIGRRHVAYDHRYGNLQSGGVLAGMVLGMGTLVRRCYIPASRISYPGWYTSTHPDVDLHWSTESLEFVHDGVEFERIDKILSIAENQVALDTLRVCTARRPDPENCRKCAKCQSTAIALHQAGTLDRCRTLGPLDPAAIRRTKIADADYVEMFKRLQRETRDPVVRDAIAVALRRSKRRARLRPAGDVLRRIGVRQ